MTRKHQNTSISKLRSHLFHTYLNTLVRFCLAQRKKSGVKSKGNFNIPMGKIKLFLLRIPFRSEFVNFKDEQYRKLKKTHYNYDKK